MFLLTFAFPRAKVPRFFLGVPCSRVPNRGSVGGGWRCNSSHARCLCMDGSGGPGQLATAQCTSILAGSRFKVKLVSRSQFPPFHLSSQYTSCLNCVSSSQQREFSIRSLLRSAFLCSCVKFAFLRTAFLKYLGRGSTGTQNQERTPISAGLPILPCVSE